MDTVSKYANLPGIVYDQPDCYETSDLPESDQPPVRIKTEDVSENVEILSVDANEAFRRFEGKSLAVTGADFTGIPTAGKGYQTWGQWELAERGVDQETPLEKYRRLQIEVQELQRTFSDMKIPSDSKASGFAGDVKLEDVSSDLKSLSEELKNLDSDSCVDSLMVGSSSAKTVAQLEQALRQSGATNQRPESDSDPTAKKGSAARTVDYELTVPLRQTQSLTLHQMDQRVRALEQLVGPEERVSLLTGVSGARSICETVGILCNKVLLMEPSHLDQLDARVNSLLEKTSVLSEKRSAIEDLERESRVNQLLQLIRETEGQRSGLPAVAARLNSLSEVEEQASQFSSAISYIDSLQNQIVRDLTSSQQDLKDLRESLNRNMTLFKETVEGFERRLEAVLK